VRANLIDLGYLVTIVTFILALRFLSSPTTARRGNQIGAFGMLVAIVATYAKADVGHYWRIAIAMALGGALGAVGARRVKMTANSADCGALQRRRRRRGGARLGSRSSTGSRRRRPGSTATSARRSCSRR